MLRQGFVPHFAHGLIEYVAAVAFIAAPFVLGFDAGTATAASIGMGVVILIVAAVSHGPTGLIDQIAVQAHVVLDFLLAFVMIGAPFIFGFSDETDPTAFFIAVGVLHLLVTIATRFVREPRERAAGRPDEERPAAPS